MSAVTPEKARQILEASLKDGSVPLSYLKAMAAGVARSGKSLSKKHVFGIDCDDPYFSISTGICEAPIFAFRSISWQLINASLKGFEPLKYKDMNAVLAHKLRMGMLRGKVAEVAKDKTGSERLSSGVASEGVGEGSVGSGSGDSAASKDVVSAVCASAEARQRNAFLLEEELFKLQVILFLDSGGQPQFHELAPALSHNVNLVLLFIKLNECLDALCVNSFTDEEGKWFTETCPSLVTNKEMLLQIVHTMLCKPLAGGEDMHTKFMVIGTYRDRMEECEETLAEKNEKLAGLLVPMLGDALIMKNANEVIIDVNAASPDEYDHRHFALIREKISDLSVATEVDTPMHSLMLLNDLNKYGEEQKKRVVSREECQTIGGRLKMDRQDLEAALFHFNQMSMLMYTPSVLPNTVFMDPQMPLDSVNRIVQHSFRVGAGAIPGLTPNECRLWKEGVVSREMLKGEEFSGCFKGGLFEAEHALKLFRSLYMIAPLNESEFIMPAMLQTVSWCDMSQYLPVPSEQVVAPLFLHFHKSRIANGVFCSTHTCIRSKYEWTTSYDYKGGKKVVACLFRNAVRLSHPTESVQITLIHAQKHFEVHLTAPEANLSSLCPEIREMVLDAVDSGASAFRYKNSRASVAFQCPCSPDDIHTATLNEAHSKLVCSVTEEVCPGGLTAGQEVWLGAGKMWC